MKKEILKFLVLAMLAIGGAPAGAAIWQWSTTTANNANADPSINWAEGMSPSSVNDSARAMMSAVAGWRDDMSGSLVATGSSTAYALTTSQGYGATPPNGTKVSFVAPVTNGVGLTLAVDGGTAFPVWVSQSTPAPSGTLIAGTPYNMTFRSGFWVMQDIIGNPYSVPLGGLLPSTLGSPPNSNFVIPAGQCISTTTYATYWAALGSPASGSCPGGQFAIIDMSGVVPAGLDNLSGSARNLLTSASTGCGTAMTTMGAKCANGTQSKSILATNLPPYTPQGLIGNGTFSVTLSTRDCCSAGVGVPGTVALGPNTGSPAPAVTGLLGGSMVFNGTPAVGWNGTALPSVQPTIGLYYFLRVL